MAVFLVNVCKFNSCGLKFASLQELIRHIEECHLDFEPKPLDNVGNATCLPVSCVLRIFSGRSDDALSSSIDLNSNTLNESHIRKSINSPAISLGSTPTDGSEMDEDIDSDSGQSSIDSWATGNADSNSNALQKFHHFMGSGASGQNLDENNNSTKHHQNGVTSNREYTCNYSGCNKRYRSSNSLSHHKRSAHKAIGNIAIPTAKPVVADENKKMFACGQCSKTYKTSHGLKNHCNIIHNQGNLNANRTSGNTCNSSSLAIASNAVQIKQEMPAQVTSFVQISTPPTSGTTTKTEISPSVKENILNSISKAKGGLNQSQCYNAIPASEIISDKNCPPVCSNVEVISEPKSIKSPPIISAPTLQQHLLSPIIPKVASS